MSNKIYIEYSNPYEKVGFGMARRTGVFPLLDDPMLEMTSSFQSMGDMIPESIKGMINLMRNFSRAMGGTASKGIETLMDLPLWQKTEPVKLVTKLLFYTASSPYDDVWLPMMGLASNAILIVDERSPNKFKTPGISLHSYGKITKDRKRRRKADYSKIKSTRDLEKVSSIIAVEIPGVIYLTHAVLKSAKPTFSKEITESGYPLWGTLDIEIRSIYPANDKMFSNLENSFRWNQLTGEIALKSLLA